jgi:hypothetical protein
LTGLQDYLQEENGLKGVLTDISLKGWSIKTSSDSFSSRRTETVLSPNSSSEERRRKALVFVFMNVNQLYFLLSHGILVFEIEATRTYAKYIHIVPKSVTVSPRVESLNFI